MTILIVDDNSSNRLTLKWILTKEGYPNITEVSGGQEAIEACRNHKFDLIFMDVMMPGMTGIEATYKIKTIDQNAMVIAVTALDDDDTTRDMFKAGAEDFVTKPIQQEIFKARLHTYIKIIENRNFHSLSMSSINLFREPVSNHFSISKIQEDGNLAEFWERYLHSSNNFQNEKLCMIISKIFNIGSLLLKMDVKFSIFFEENENEVFFTINNTGVLNHSIIEEMIRKERFCGKYIIGNDRISFASDKIATYCEEAQSIPTVIQEQPASTQTTIATFVTEPAAALVENEQQEIAYEEPQPKTDIVIDSTIPRTQDELFVFDYMDENDCLDIEEYIKDLDRYLILLQSSKLESIDVQNLAFKIEKIAAILSIYHETYELGMSLKSLAYDIRDNVEEFMANSKTLSIIFASFTKDLLEWYTKLFKTGATSINFFDATIIANAMMMSSAIKPHEVLEEDGDGDMDDIFF